MPEGARDPRIGEVYLSADELAARVDELGAEIARDYDGREPLLVGSLKASLVFLADLSRAIPILHALDLIPMCAHGIRGVAAAWSLPVAPQASCEAVR